MAYVCNELNSNDPMFGMYDGIRPLGYCRVFRMENAPSGGIDECIVRVVSDENSGDEVVVGFHLLNGHLIADYFLNTLLWFTGDVFGLSAVDYSYVIDTKDLHDILTDIDAFL